VNRVGTQAARRDHAQATALVDFQVDAARDTRPVGDLVSDAPTFMAYGFRLEHRGRHERILGTVPSPIKPL
jgi:hypothetical protein